MLALNRLTPSARRRPTQLFGKYAAIIALLVSGALVTSSLVELYFTNVEIRQSRGELLGQEAKVAAGRIDQFVQDIRGQIEWAIQPLPMADAEADFERYVSYLSLLRLAPAITELSYLDQAGIEQLRVSRLTRNVVGSGIDYSQQERFTWATSDAGTYFGPLYLHDNYEPYMTIAVRGQTADAGITVAEVNLTYVRDVVDRIRIGRTGYAFVVDEQGRLVAHRDINLMYQQLNLSACPQVSAALGPRSAAVSGLSTEACRPDVLSGHARIEPLRWTIIVEQLADEAFEPLYGSVLRTIALLLVGLGISGLASLVLARRLVTPIHSLRLGAERIGAGDLDQRIEVRTGDELEALAGQFNRMAEQLHESYATLERRVEERTRELSDALERQTAISMVLRIIAGSPADRQTVLEAVTENAARLCEASRASLWLCEGDTLRRAAAYGTLVGRLGDEHPLTGDSITARAAREAQTVHLPDLEALPETIFTGSERRFQYRHRSAVSTPVLRGGQAVAVISLGREQARPFSRAQIELLETFADQVAIALETTRLFEELGQRIEELRGLSDVSRAVSSTLDLEQVLATIVEQAVQLSGGDGGAIYELDESTSRFRLRGTSLFDAQLTETLRNIAIAPGEGAVGRAGQERAAVQIPDISETGAYEWRLREELLGVGLRSLLAVPLMVENRVIGGLVVGRRRAGAFPSAVVELLQTFAAQSALGIQNARLYQELQLASVHKSLFIAHMSHELRTPLGAIIGFTRNMKDEIYGDVPAAFRDPLQRVQNSAEHLQNLIEDILDFAAIELGQVNLKHSGYTWHDLWQTVQAMTQPRADKKGLCLSACLEPDLPPGRGDERRLRQVLINLVDNAVKFTDAGEVRVAITAAGDEFRVAVRDTGPGIPEAERQRVFDEFHQVDRSNTRRKGGTGLGLAIARRLVELHGGWIWVESVEGEGSTFRFVLPITAQDRGEMP